MVHQHPLISPDPFLQHAPRHRKVVNIHSMKNHSWRGYSADERTLNSFDMLQRGFLAIADL